MLAALTAKHLRSRFHDHQTFVATVFIHEDVIANELSFMEDFLCSLYDQLSPPSAFIDEESMDTRERYYNARDAGERAYDRINLIRKAVLARLSDCPRVFFILDGFDRCSATLSFLIESELRTFQEQKLSIMVTSRFPVFRKPENINCDTHGYEPDDIKPQLNIFWECTNCGETIMCFPCKEEGKVCPNW